MDVELSLMKIAFNHIAHDAAFGQRPWSMRAVIVGDIEFAVEVEDGEFQTLGFHFKGGSGGNVRNAVQLNSPAHEKN